MSRAENLHCRIAGNGDRVLVFAHGFGADQTAWDGLRPWAERHFRVVSFDLAGAGPGGERSYDPQRHATLYGFVDDLIDLLDELRLRDVFYVGHSVSGMIGTAAAVSRPDLFARLVMIGASPRYLNDGDYRGGFEQGDLDAVFAAMATNFQAWGAGFAPGVVGVPDHPAVDEFCRTLFEMRPDIALAVLRTIFQSDMRAVAKRLPRPAVLIQTAADLAVPLAVAEWLRDNLPDARLEVIDAQGHLPYRTAPGEVLRVLAQSLPLDGKD